MITLGIDIGTTHTKVLALDAAAGRTLAVESAPTPAARGMHGDSRQADDVLQAALSLIARVVRSVGEPQRIRAISVASVGEEVVLLDAGGQPVGEVIAWFDPRGVEQAADFASGAGRDLALVRRWPPDPSFSLFKLLWIRDHRAPDLQRAVTWIDLGGYVLTGLGGDPAMDWTHASRVGAFDLVARQWDRDTIRAADLGRLAFPRLVASRTILGTLSRAAADRTGLSEDVALAAGGHDHLCAAYAAGLRSTTELFISAGTSEAHLALVRGPVEPRPGRLPIDQGCYLDVGTYYIHLPVPSGHVFQQWRSLLYGNADEATLYAEVARVPPGAEGVRFDLLDDLRSGRLDGLPYTADRAVVMCAVLEGLARRSADVVRTLEEAAGTRFEQVVVAGHATRVPYWRALRMATYGRPIVAVDESESAAMGAAILAAEAVGVPDPGRLVARRVPWRRERPVTG